MQLVPSLPQPLDGVEGSVVYDPVREQLLLTSLDDHSLLGLRSNLTLSASADFGVHWEHARVIDSGPSAYSALVRLSNGSIGVLFEQAKEMREIFIPDQIGFGIALP